MQISIQHITSYVAYTPINMDKEKGTKKKNDFTKDILTIDSKIVFIGLYGKKLIMVSFGWLPPDDRDSVANKSFELSGTLLDNLYRNHFNKLVKGMQKHILKEINNGPWRSMDNFENIINIINI